MSPSRPSSGHDALGMVETRGLIAAIEAADAMMKASSVSLLGMEKADAGLVTILIEGETAAVQSSVDAGRAAAEKVGQVVSAHVIPRPANDIRIMQESDVDQPGTRSSSSEDIEAMTVRELRAFARTQEGLSIQGREIARANRQQLLDALRNR